MVGIGWWSNPNVLHEMSSKSYGHDWWIILSIIGLIKWKIILLIIGLINFWKLALMHHMLSQTVF